jgi:hypothetical protein
MKIFIVNKDMGEGVLRPMWAYDNAEDALKSARQDALNDREQMIVSEINFYPIKLRDMLA